MFNDNRRADRYIDAKYEKKVTFAHLLRKLSADFSASSNEVNIRIKKQTSK